MRRLHTRRPSGEPRNPPWVRDEEMPLLDLYLWHAPKTERGSHVVALSELLNALPIHAPSERASTFRKPTGVFMKLGNLRPIDPKYPGRDWVA